MRSFRQLYLTCTMQLVMNTCTMQLKQGELLQVWMDTTALITLVNVCQS